MTRERGQGAIEYVGALAVVALVVAALATAAPGAAATLTAVAQRTTCAITGSGCRPGDDGTPGSPGVAGGARGGGDAPVMAARTPVPRLRVAFASVAPVDGPSDPSGCDLAVSDGALSCAPPDRRGGVCDDLGGLTPGSGSCAPPRQPVLPDCRLALPGAAGSCAPRPAPTFDPCGDDAPLTAASSYCPDPVAAGEDCAGPTAALGPAVAMCADEDRPGRIVDAAADQDDSPVPWLLRPLPTGRPTADPLAVPYRGEATNHRPGEGIVPQSNDWSCGPACGEMVTDGRYTEEELLEVVGVNATPQQIADDLNGLDGVDTWTAQRVRSHPIATARAVARGPVIADLHAGDADPTGHAVVIEPIPTGNALPPTRFRVRDPDYGTYDVTLPWIRRWVRTMVWQHP
jgi:hypothetical protein